MEKIISLIGISPFMEFEDNGGVQSIGECPFREY